MDNLKTTELVLNPDGSIYHLNLLPGDIASNIILAGDPDRVEIISSFFDSVEIKKRRREFVTHTGYYRGTRVSAIATGIGTDNIDIVLTEIDALANIDIHTRQVKKEHRKLNFIRIGTTGSLQKDIPVDSFVISEMAMGFDGLLNFYARRDEVCDKDFEETFKKAVEWDDRLASPYVVPASGELFRIFSGEGMIPGVTISAPGFYGPQGRELRLRTADPMLNDKIEQFRHGSHRISNYEMESSAIYGLSRLLGHEAVTVCAVIANRSTKTYSTRHEETMLKLIDRVLGKLVPEEYE